MYLITCMQDCNEYNPPCIWSHEIVFVYLIMYLIIWDWFEYTLLCSWSHEIILSTSQTMYLITWNLSEYTSPCTSSHKSTPHSVFDYMDCFDYMLSFSTPHNVNDILRSFWIFLSIYLITRSFWVHLTICNVLDHMILFFVHLSPYTWPH